MMQNDEEETQGSKSVQETGEVTATRLIINPEAEPTYLQMEILSNFNPKFRLTWEMKRSDLEDSSPIGYDMELANFGVAADLHDQVILDLIIAFRSRNNLTKELRMDYYLRTLEKAKAEFARTQVIAKQLDRMAGTESEDEEDNDNVQRRAEAMESLQVIFPGFVIRRITIFSNSTKTSFRMETNRGNIRLHSIEDLLQQPRFTRRVAQEIHRVLDLKFKKREWLAVAQLILDASVPEDRGGDFIQRRK
jgi:hypothetical protein